MVNDNLKKASRLLEILLDEHPFDAADLVNAAKELISNDSDLSRETKTVLKYAFPISAVKKTVAIDLKQASAIANQAIRLFYFGDYELNEVDQDDRRYRFGFNKKDVGGLKSDLFVCVNRCTGLVDYIGN